MMSGRKVWLLKGQMTSLDGTLKVHAQVFVRFGSTNLARNRCGSMGRFGRARWVSLLRCAYRAPTSNYEIRGELFRGDPPNGRVSHDARKLADEVNT